MAQMSALACRVALPTLIGPDRQAKDRDSLKGWRKNRVKFSSAMCNILLFKTRINLNPELSIMIIQNNNNKFVPLSLYTMPK